MLLCKNVLATGFTTYIFAFTIGRIALLVNHYAILCLERIMDSLNSYSLI